MKIRGLWPIDNGHKAARRDREPNDRGTGVSQSLAQPQELRRINLAIPLALHVPHQLILAWEGIITLIPGAFGRRVRLGARTIHAIFIQLIHAEPQNIANIDLADKEQRVRVVVRTFGLGGRE
ncbi:MAG: hypothetical protein FWG43_01795 [Clostridiales bacterium]|nr:hypothetical protein [Clostridiales bacterium]